MAYTCISLSGNKVRVLSFLNLKDKAVNQPIELDGLKLKLIAIAKIYRCSP